MLYQYSFQSAANVFAGYIQTESAYYQPNPPAPAPFTPLASWHDPTFSSSRNGATSNSGWGLYIGGQSKNVFVYGAGLYSFFNNYNVHCSDRGNGETCQSRIFLHEGTGTVSVYGLTTVGTTNMATRELQRGAALAVQDVARYSDNLAGFTDSIALYRWNR